MKHGNQNIVAFSYVLFCLSTRMQKEIPDFCKPILEAWGANNEKGLMDAMLKWRGGNLPKSWKSLHKGAKTPVDIQLGGTTKELLKNYGVRFKGVPYVNVHLYYYPENNTGDFYERNKAEMFSTV